MEAEELSLIEKEKLLELTKWKRLACGYWEDPVTGLHHPSSTAWSIVESSESTCDEDLAVLWQMRANGGGFASALAEAGYRADSRDLARIKSAFADTWEAYRKLALEKSKKGLAPGGGVG
jgi:hypothetical protein